MSLLHRRKRIAERVCKKNDKQFVIPPLAELKEMKAGPVRAIAERLGLEYTNKTQAIKAIDAAR